MPYLPTTLLQAGHPPTRSRPGAVIRRWQRNCPYKPLRGRTQADTQNDRYHKVPAIRYHIWTSYLWLYYTSEHMNMQQRGLDSFRQFMLFVALLPNIKADRVYPPAYKLYCIILISCCISCCIVVHHGTLPRIHVRTKWQKNMVNLLKHAKKCTVTRTCVRWCAYSHGFESHRLRCFKPAWTAGFLFAL